MRTKPTIAAITMPFDPGAGRRGASKGPKAIYKQDNSRSTANGYHNRSYC